MGPHADSYDVFLLQGMGRKRWSISQDPQYAPDRAEASHTRDGMSCRPREKQSPRDLASKKGRFVAVQSERSVVSSLSRTVALSRLARAQAYLDGAHVLRDFVPEATFDLEPGDALYVPPNVAHHGVALEASETGVSDLS